MTQPLSVVLVGLVEAVERDLAREDGLTVRRVDAVSDLVGPVTDDAVVVALATPGPLETLRAIRAVAPDPAVIVVTDPANEADGSVALHAGADDHLLDDATLPILLPRSIRYAASLRQLRRELATIDEVTGLPNLRGFAPIAEHHLRMADRLRTPVVLVFVRLDDHGRLLQEHDPEAADALARDAAGIVLEAVRDADLPARLAPDTLCVLLTGDASGAETLVLSRLVEAIAVHDAAREHPRSLALSVGTARYEPGSAAGLAEILEGAARGLAGRAGS
jgi:diguanylate cyclase (GGDEF)-like protein